MEAVTQQQIDAVDPGRRRPRAGGPRLALGALVVLALGVAWSTVAPPAGAQDGGVVADWRLDERRGSTVLVDSSGNGLNGRIGAAVITEVRLPVGIVHRYPATYPPNGRTGHVHTVPDSSRLDPGSGSFGVTVWFRTGRPTQNMVQKGQSGVAGGYWKVEMESGRARCLFRGGSGDAGVASPGRVDDGAWHELRCVRRDGRVRMELDGREVASTVDDAGVVANTWELAIGGKSRCDQVRVDCDLFSGDMNGVRIDHGVVK
jgi:hypothetical protein